MLRKSLYGVLAATLLVVGAQSAEAQLHFNVNAGVTMPMSDAGDVWSAGLRAGAGLEFRAPLVPLGLRVDGAYDRMGPKLSGAGVSNLSILSGAASAVFSLPLMPIYAVGGLGMYRSDDGSGTTSTDLGFNIGMGLRLPLPMLSPFVEARFHQINGDGGNFRYVPIVAGIRF
jgi:hypothetical protein